MPESDITIAIIGRSKERVYTAITQFGGYICSRLFDLPHIHRHIYTTHIDAHLAIESSKLSKSFGIYMIIIKLLTINYFGKLFRQIKLSLFCMLFMYCYMWDKTNYNLSAYNNI